MIKKLIATGLKFNIKGFGFLTRVIFNNAIKIKNKYGVIFCLNPYEKIDSHILRFGYFDQEVLDLLTKNIKENDVFWDIGANIGLHTLTLKSIHPQLDCHCFEPYYKNFDRLIINKELNKSDVHCYNFALHDSTKIFNLRTTLGNHGATGILQNSGSSDTGFKIRTVSIQELIINKELTPPTIIKIDTEGNEYNILYGLRAAITNRTIHTIVFESNYDINRISSYLTAHNYITKQLGNSSNYYAKLLPPK